MLAARAQAEQEFTERWVRVAPTWVVPTKKAHAC
jgi:hypothetical protein